MNCAEEWREVAGTGGNYAVSDFGRVVSTRSGKILKPINCGSGYLRVHLPNGLRSIHGLVLEAFVGPRPDGMQCCHNNGDKSDNRLVNLRWDTPLSNSRDKHRHGTTSRGEHRWNSVLTEELLRAMMEEYIPHSKRHGAAALARKYGLKYSTVSKALSGINWKHLKEAK